MNLREIAEQDLSVTLEGEFGLPVILVDPDGVIYGATEDDAIDGQILYDTVRHDPNTGESIVANQPIVVLRRSSLVRVPEPGETWMVKIPIIPSRTAPKVDFIISPTRPPEGGRSIGFIRLYLTKVAQS